MVIAFVVLHYKVESVTKECIEYLLRQDYQNYRIIVIDNCSLNGSYEKLVEEYKNESHIYFASIEYNLGFAKANDLGYQIAKHKFNAECIAVINNDLMIEDTKFCKKLDAVCKNVEFDILGPDIINKVGVHQNPLKGCISNKSQLNKMILTIYIKLLLIPMFYSLNRKKGLKQSDVSMASLETTEGVPLHGSCLIFGKQFVDRFEFPFYPETFLYGEEDILYYLVKKRNLKTIFYPDLKVYHMEDVSTDSISKNRKEKRIFELKNSLKSLVILKALMK